MPNDVGTLRNRPGVYRDAIGLCLLLSCGGTAVAYVPADGDGGIPVDGSAPGDSSVYVPDSASGGVVEGSVDFQAFVHVTISAPSNTRQKDLPVSLQVEVARAGVGVLDARVIGGGTGQASEAKHIGGGRYLIEERGYSPWYEVTVEAGSAVLRGVRLRAPQPHAITVPGKGRAGKSAMIKWAPHHDEAVDDVGIRVISVGVPNVTLDTHALDSGEFELPASALATAGSYFVQVRRAASVTLASPQSTGLVDMISTAELMVN